MRTAHAGFSLLVWEGNSESQSYQDSELHQPSLSPVSVGDRANLSSLTEKLTRQLLERCTEGLSTGTCK